MPDRILAAFERRIAVLPLAAVLPGRVVPQAALRTVRFKRIERSMAEIGIIEPLVVAPLRDGIHLLLDGHLRYAVLKATGATQVRCLVATDDEAFTYNKRVNHLATVQEHLMIVRAIEKGVPEEKTARALNVEVGHIRARQTMLNGICPEAIDLLKDKPVAPHAFKALRRMRPVRQIEAAELMISMSNYTASYADLLLAGTQKRDLLHPEKPKRVGGMTPEQIARMEQEMESVHRNFRDVEASFRKDSFDLVLASGYLAKLLRKPEIERFLEQRHPEILEGFQAVVAATSLDPARTAA